MVTGQRKRLLFIGLLVAMALIGIGSQSTIWINAKSYLVSQVGIFQNHNLNTKYYDLKYELGRNDSCVYILQTVSYLVRSKLWSPEQSIKWFAENYSDIESQRTRDCIYLASINKNRITFSLFSIIPVYLFGFFGFLFIPIIATILLFYRIFMLIDLNSTSQVLVASLFFASPVMYFALRIGPEILIYLAITELCYLFYNDYKNNKLPYHNYRIIVYTVLISFAKGTFVFVTPLFLLFVIFSKEKRKKYIFCMAVSMSSALLWLISSNIQASPQEVLNNPNSITNTTSFSPTYVKQISTPDKPGFSLKPITSSHVEDSPVIAISEFNQFVTNYSTYNLVLTLFLTLLTLIGSKLQIFISLILLIGSLLTQSYNLGNLGLNFRYMAIPFCGALVLYLLENANTRKEIT